MEEKKTPEEEIKEEVNESETEETKEAEAEANRLWENGEIDDSKIEEWGKEHLRTPYVHS